MSKYRMFTKLCLHMRVGTIEHVSIFGTWFLFHHSYRIEGLDDQEFHPINFRRQVALENERVQYELYFQF